MDLAGAELEGHAALAAAVGGQQAGGEVFVVAGDLAELQGGLKKRMQHVEARLVGGVPGAFDLHSAERPDRDVPRVLPAPGAAPVLQLDELARGLVDEDFDGVLISQPVGAADGVVDVVFAGVVGLDDGGHAPLGGHGVAAHGVDLGHQANGEIGTGFHNRHCGAQPGPTGADDDDVVVDFVHKSDLREAGRGLQLMGLARLILRGVKAEISGLARFKAGQSMQKAAGGSCAGGR